MPSVFLRHLVGKWLRNVFDCGIAYMLCWEVSDLAGIFLSETAMATSTEKLVKIGRVVPKI